MALGIGRLSFIPFIGCFALLQGCFTTTTSDDASSGGTGGSSSGGCTKDTDCRDPRVCVNKVCVDPSGTSTGGSGGSTAGSSGSSGTGGTGTGGTDTGVACVDGTDPIMCPSADSMSICYGGTYQTLTCESACTTLGFEIGPCVDTYGCQCGYPTDAECEAGVNVFCSCVDGTDQPCADGDPVTDPFTLYENCHFNDPQADADFLKCLGAQAGSDVTCAEAADACP